MHKEKAQDKPEPSLMKFLNYNLFLLYHSSFELSTLQKNKRGAEMLPFVCLNYLLDYRLYFSMYPPH